jgi:hypothetical protein
VWMDRLHDFDSWSSQSFSEIEGWWHFKFIFKKLSEVFPWIIHWWKGLVLLCVHFLCFWGVALFKMTRNTLSHLGLASPVLPLRSRVFFFFFFDLRRVFGPAYAHHGYSPRPTEHPASPRAGKAPRGWQACT